MQFWGPTESSHGRKSRDAGFSEGEVSWGHVQPLNSVGVNRLGQDHHTKPVSPLCAPGGLSIQAEDLQALGCSEFLGTEWA